ncbi:MAG: hypothetical protein HND57_04750 [Planctomycetes bacterium]|nr:hypothetical protein [Planctomycetota bacterium]
MEINHVYAVRHIWAQELLDHFFTSGEGIDNCYLRSAQFAQWGTGGGISNPKEIVLSYRHPHVDPPEDLDPDSIPSEADGRSDKLLQLADMSYRLHSCIDYVQLGNEIFGGPGVYYFEPGDLQGCTGSVSYGKISALRGNCVEFAMNDAEDWLRDQARAIRVGSAYAGRPLRVVGPALTRGQVTHFYDGNSENPNLESALDAGAYRLMRAISLCNDLDIPVDLHLHYEDDPATEDQVTDALEKLHDTYAGNGAPWPVPTSLVVLEWGPAVDTDGDPGDWWDDDVEGAALLRMYDNLPTSYASWDAYIDDWRTSADWDGNSFRINYALDEIADYGALLACYGETIQRGSSSNPVIWDLTCQRAHHIGVDYFDQSNPLHWTQINTSFQNAADQHDDYFETYGFTPHLGGCPCELFCIPLDCFNGG